VGFSFPSPSAITFHDQAEMIATEVCKGIGVTTWMARDQIVKQAELELESSAKTKTPITMDELRDGMIQQWTRYREAIRQGKMGRGMDMSAPNFFGEGRWKNSKEWGLKKGVTVDGIDV
jgi:hypothetical protein